MNEFNNQNILQFHLVEEPVPPTFDIYYASVRRPRIWWTPAVVLGAAAVRCNKSSLNYPNERVRAWAVKKIFFVNRALLKTVYVLNLRCIFVFHWFHVSNSFSTKKKKKKETIIRLMVDVMKNTKAWKKKNKIKEGVVTPYVSDRIRSPYEALFDNITSYRRIRRNDIFYR